MQIGSIYVEEWQVWVALAILSFILEIFTPGFVLACLGVGFLAGALGSALEMSYTWQLLFFSAGTAVTFFAIRPFILKIGYKDAEKVKTNADSLIGRNGLVETTINNAEDKGAVKIDGDVWRAISLNGQVIEKGQRVIVKERDSIILTVEEV